MLHPKFGRSGFSGGDREYLNFPDFTVHKRWLLVIGNAYRLPPTYGIEYRVYMYIHSLLSSHKHIISSMSIILNLF